MSIDPEAVLVLHDDEEQADAAGVARQIQRQSRSPLVRGGLGTWTVLRTALHERSGAIGLAILLFFTFLAVFGAFIAPQDPNSTAALTGNCQLCHPSTTYWLGTTDQGSDVLSQLIYGARTTMLVGFAAALVSTVIGAFVGISAGFFGGWTDRILSAIDDFFLVLPFLPLAIVLLVIFGGRAQSWPGGQTTLLIIVIGITGWAGTSRIIRSQVLSVKERQFIERARALGARGDFIATRHVLPNVMPLLFANTVLIVSLAILAEATLSFIGLGDPNAWSWGRMLELANSAGALQAGAWWWFLPPGICIMLVVMAFTMVGQAIEAIINPKLKERTN